MSYNQDVDGFRVPLTPPASASRVASAAPSEFTWGAGTSDPARSARSLVEGPSYKVLNLADNNIFLRHSCDPIPEDIAGLVDSLRHDRDSPGPTLDEVRQDRRLHNLRMGAGKPEVESYFGTQSFPMPEVFDSVSRVNRTPMHKHTVPSIGLLMLCKL
jgi:hypothetical protein